jgi:hypothetical protein
MPRKRERAESEVEVAGNALVRTLLGCCTWNVVSFVVHQLHLALFLQWLLLMPLWGDPLTLVAKSRCAPIGCPSSLACEISPIDRCTTLYNHIFILLYVLHDCIFSATISYYFALGLVPSTSDNAIAGT